MTVNVMLDEGAYMPVRAYEEDAGADLRSPVDAVVRRNDSVVINTGVHVEIPKGYVGMLKSKSGLNVRYGLTGEGVIDAGYTGAIVCKLYNHGETFYKIRKGEKIIQLVIVPIVTPDFEIVDRFETTKRGSNGFGSTGKVIDEDL